MAPESVRGSVASCSAHPSPRPAQIVSPRVRPSLPEHRRQKIGRSHGRRDRRCVAVSAVAAKPAEKGKRKKGKKGEEGEAEEGISPDVARELYYDMYLGREFEEMCAQMYYRGKMFGFVHLYSGQEAVSSGAIRLLRPDDYVCSTYRDHVHALSKGVPAREVMAELFGKQTGVCRGQGGSMHMFSRKHNFLGGFAFIGEGIPVGLGAAFQTKYRREALQDESADQVTLSFFGDGTCNNGQFYECLNMAGLYKLPHIFVVENNKWAIGMYHNRATGPSFGDTVPNIYKKGEPFGMPGIHVDGMDIVKVREAVSKAVARARAGDGPTLIECETYRFRGHSLADPDELRTQEEKERYAKRDPIPAFRKYVLDNKILTEADLKDIEKQVVECVEDSVQFAEASPKPEKGQLLENVFADPRGFGTAPDGGYRYEQAGFTSGTAQVS